MSEKPIIFNSDSKDLNTYKNKRILALIFSLFLFTGLYFFMEYFDLDAIGAVISASIITIFYQFQSPYVQVFIDDVEIKVVKYYSFFRRVKSIPLIKCSEVEVTIKEKDQVTLRYQLKGQSVKRIRISSLTASSTDDIKALNEALKENMVLQLNQENSSS